MPRRQCITLCQLLLLSRLCCCCCHGLLLLQQDGLVVVVDPAGASWQLGNLCRRNQQPKGSDPSKAQQGRATRCTVQQGAADFRNRGLDKGRHTCKVVCRH